MHAQIREPDYNMWLPRVSNAIREEGEVVDSEIIKSYINIYV